MKHLVSDTTRYSTWIAAGIAAAAWITFSLAPHGAESPGSPGVGGGVPVGTILAFGGPANAVPESGGWMLCDGRELSAAQFPQLHAVLGSAWGRGRNGTFLLPDLRGRFLRGVTYDAGGELRDPDRDKRGASGPGGNAGNEVGSLQEDTTGPHQHALAGVADAVGQGAAAEFIRFHAGKVPDDSAPILNNTWAVQSLASTESRPRNANVNWIIRTR